MTFKESVISVYVKNYANFQGKASRSELWWAALLYLIVSLVGGVVIGIIVGMNFLLPYFKKHNKEKPEDN